MKTKSEFNLDEAEKFIQQITKNAGKIVGELYGKVGVAYTKKNPGDMVTKADLLSHKYLVSSIKKKYPTHGIISEEAKQDYKKTEYTWIIDPLDGTRNFATRTPLYGVMVALAKGDELLLGAIYLPELKELCFARKGKGAFLNGKQIKCSNVNKLEYSYGTSGCRQSQKSAPINGALIEKSETTSFWVNSIGCYAVMAAYVSSGRRDWLVNSSVSGVWDLAAPYIIMKESGCKVTNINGEEFSISIQGTGLISANPVLHKEIIKIINKTKKK
ncbi:MAG: inositol monophosphatase family protein [Candidatus Nanoarchaeia archaeon]